MLHVPTLVDKLSLGLGVNWIPKNESKSHSSSSDAGADSTTSNIAPRVRKQMFTAWLPRHTTKTVNRIKTEESADELNWMLFKWDLNGSGRSWQISTASVFQSQTVLGKMFGCMSQCCTESVHISSQTFWCSGWCHGPKFPACWVVQHSNLQVYTSDVVNV